MQSGKMIVTSFAVVVAGCGLGLGGLGAELTDAGGGLDARATNAASSADGTTSPEADGSAPGAEGSTSPELADASTSPADDASTGELDGGEPSVGSCLASIPAGWRLVLHEPARAVCPTGTAHDVLEDPRARAGACSCGCALTSMPSCWNGSLQPLYGTSGSAGCSEPAIPVDVSAGCVPLPTPAQIAPRLAFPPLAMTGGACAGTAIGHVKKVDVTAARTCDVPADGQAESLCAGSPPAGFDACIATTGDLACPLGTPFTRRIVVADSLTLLCSACTACTIGGGCSPASVTLYGDTQCTGKLGSVRADGTCVKASFTGTVAALSYEALVLPTCSASGTQASFLPVAPTTLCCR